MKSKYDLIVIGGGTAGSVVMHRAAAKGLKVAVIEAEQIGGTCVNVGCIPSKILIHTARIMALVKGSAEFGIHSSEPQADWPAVLKRKGQIVGKMRDGGYRSILGNENITLFEGEASFAGPGHLRVNGETIYTGKIIIAAGARPAIPDLPGLADLDYLTSTSIMEMEKLPESLLIIGGGIIALEFSQLFARLGVQVTILQRNRRLVPKMEEDISAEIQKILLEEGVNVITGVEIKSAGRDEKGIYVLEESSGRLLRYQAEKLLVAAGRTPNSDRLALQSVGVDVDKKGYIKVDSSFKTSARDIWAAGDITGGPMFTHKAWHDGFLLASHLLDGQQVKSEGRLVPVAVFTDPEIAVVGLGEQEAKDAGFDVEIKKYHFEDHGRNMVDGKLKGFIKLVVEQDSGKLLGAHLIGSEAAELLHELIAVIRFEGKITDLQDMMHIHPTLAEAINSASFK